jgi:50S ribosomal subunit-associated GTPase HflX
LLEIIEAKLGLSREIQSFMIPHQRYELVAKLRREGSLIEEKPEDNGVRIQAYPSDKVINELSDFELLGP